MSLKRVKSPNSSTSISKTFCIIPKIDPCYSQLQLKSSESISTISKNLPKTCIKLINVKHECTNTNFVATKSDNLNNNLTINVWITECDRK